MPLVQREIAVSAGPAVWGINGPTRGCWAPRFGRTSVEAELQNGYPDLGKNSQNEIEAAVAYPPLIGPGCVKAFQGVRRWDGWIIGNAVRGGEPPAHRETGGATPRLAPAPDSFCTVQRELPRQGKGNRDY